MGLLKLLALPVEGPIRGIMWIAEKVAEGADNELNDGVGLREQLTQLELLYDMGEISEEEHMEAEEALFRRLKAIQERSEAA